MNEDRLAHLKQTLHKSQTEITQEVLAVATYYPNMVKVYEPLVPILRLLPDWESERKT
jgi:hypothetical protein